MEGVIYMYCEKCNKHFGREYVVCPDCGAVLRDEGDFQNKTDFQNQTDSQNPTVVEDKSVTYILLSVAMLFCCSPIAGIVALVLSIIASNNFKRGDYDGAIDMWKATKITLWVGVGLFVASFIFSVLVFGGSLAGMSAIMNNY